MRTTILQVFADTDLGLSKVIRIVCAGLLNFVKIPQSVKVCRQPLE